MEPEPDAARPRFPLRAIAVALGLVALLAGLVVVLVDGPATPPRGTGAEAAPVAEPVTTPTASRIWKPRRGVTWQWQLSGRIDTSVKAKVYDLDYSVSKSVVDRLHAKNRRVVCYLSAGSWERFRPDARRFPASVRGKVMDGWPDEKWLDIRKRSVLKPIMAARMDQCRAKGFDGVEADNVDGYQNRTGFPLTAKHQRRYNIMLAKLAHARGLAIGLKNDLAQIKTLQPYFEFAVNEQCAEYDECDAYKPFLRAGKPVLHAEYALTKSEFCPTARRLGLSSIRKKLSLSAWRRSC